MKKVLVFVMVAVVLTAFCGCTAVSKVARGAAEQSTTEFIEWNKLLKAKIDALPTDEVKPFFIYFTEIVGEDKKNLPYEASQIIDQIRAILDSKKAVDFTIEDKALLTGKWDRFWIVILKETGTMLINNIVSRIKL